MTILIIAELLIIIAIFYIFKITLKDVLLFTSSLFLKKPFLKSQIARQRKKTNDKWIDFLLYIQSLLILKHIKQETLYSISFLLGLFGAYISIFIIKNLVFTFSFTLFFGLFPFIYLLFSGNAYKKQIINELETALMSISISYNRTNNFVRAVEENIFELNQPIKNAFVDFLNEVNYINPDIKLALKLLSTKIPNSIFEEWCYAVIKAQDNSNIRYSISFIAHKLSDTKMVNIELETILYEPIKEYIMLCVLLISTIFSTYFFQKKWFSILFFTSIGQFVLGICFTVLVLTAVGTVIAARPIEYK